MNNEDELTAALAQSLKAAAEKATPGSWRAFKYHDGRCGIGGGHHDEIMVCEHISKRRPHDAEFIAMANPASVLALVEALEKAQQRITQLESRTVTVKMPKLKMLEDYLAEVAVEERKAILLGVRMEFHRALNAEGIKWDTE